jgi:hypothetical protein
MAEHQYFVDEVDGQDNTISNVAICATYEAAVAAFEAIAKENPENRYMLRHGSRVIGRSHSCGGIVHHG